jgi:chromodomain-helicase-DNA-binding protein 1
VVQPSSHVETSLPFPSGNDASIAENSLSNGVSFSDSESELSEPADQPMASASSSSQEKLENVANYTKHSEDENDDAVGSEDDGDYDMDLSMQQAGDEASSQHSSSDESLRPPKRKAPTTAIDHEEYIRNNPDLYGLRRSHRARPSRPMLDDSSDQNDSDSDVATRPRKRLRQSSRQSSKQATPMNGSEGNSDNDSDNYGGARARLTKKQRRRFLESGASLTPSHAEVRFSTRKAAKISNYNEDDDDDMFDQAESEMMTPNFWPAGQEDTRPAIDVVLNHRLKAANTTLSPSKDDFEYLIKWQQKAYYHATWETTETLANCRSIRRLENYVRKTLSADLRVMHEPDISPEEKEKWILDREQYIDALSDYSKVERVIGVRDGEDGTEYYVKWKGLFYDQSTWEPASLVSDIAQTEIDRFLDRTSQLPVSDKTESNPATRSKPQRILEQPTYIQNGVLRDFQMTGLNFLAYNWAKGKNVVLADEMGLGKTVQTVAFINWLRHARDQQGPFIVVVPLSTMPAWADTFDLWTPDINYVVYNGKQEARNVIKDYELLVDGNVRRPKFHVLLTTYEYVLHDANFLSQMKWQFLAVDEAHRLKNRESQLYDKLKEFRAPSRLLITGTPVQNNLGELSALFDFLMPGIVNIDETMDLSSEAASAKIAELTEAIKPYMLRRTKQKVEKDLPPKSEKIIRVELSDIQLEYYRNILTKNYAALNQGAKGQKQSLLNIMMELKKASNHPFMFPSAEDRLLAHDARRDEMLRALITSSGKMMLLDQLLAKLKRDNHRVLIFSQMVKMLDILGDYMDARGHAYQRLDGTIAAGARRIAIDHFNAPGSTDFCFLLSTRAGGLGINLMTADTVIIFDSDWNPQADLQAMARAHRIGQVRPVSVYRLVSKDTVEEEILERARNKLMLEYLTIQQGVTDKETQARRNAYVGEPGNSSEISRILKKRGQKMFDQTDNQKKLEELDLDSVLEKAEDYKVEQPEGTDADGGEEFLRSFDFVDVKVDELSWDDIIPKEHLEAVKAEEQRKADEKYLADVIEQNKPRVRNTIAEEREERQAKRQQRTQAMESGSDSDEGVRADPKRPLSEREYRYLIKGHLRYGSIDDRTDEFLAEARLRGRDMGVVKAAMQEIIDKAGRLVKEEQERMEALGRTSSRTLTKKDKKAVLFEHHGVKRINAETILDRPDEMLLLQNVTSAVADPRSFRIPDATKGAGYSCNWGAREDGMLCVGIARHGYGAWEKIRDDSDLGLSDKLFLEEHRVDKKAERERQEGKNAKSPGAVHLVRRADYLISVLKGKVIGDPAAKKAVENHHRNNKKSSLHDTSNLNGATSFSASPVPSAHRKPPRDSDKHRQRAMSHGHRESMERHATPRLEHRHSQGVREDGHREKKHRHSEPHHHHHRHKSNDYQTNGTVGGDAGDEMLKLIFKPVRESLKIIQSATKSNLPDAPARANILREHLRILGNFVRATLDDDGASLEGRLW